MEEESIPHAISLVVVRGSTTSTVPSDQQHQAWRPGGRIDGTLDESMRSNKQKNERHRSKTRVKLDNMDIRAYEIHTYISQCPKLTTLSLAKNPIRTIPRSLVEGHNHLKSLNLSQCKIFELPIDLTWNLPKLETLDLSHNRLREFPREHVFQGIPALKRLNLYGNKLTQITLPWEAATRLSKLEELNVGYNDIFHLSGELRQCPRLQRLILCNNFIESIPEEICNIKTLRYLDVSFNPCIIPPLEVCENGVGSMRRFFKCRRLEEEAQEKYRRVSKSTTRNPDTKPSPVDNSTRYDRSNLASRAWSALSKCFRPKKKDRGSVRRDIVDPTTSMLSSTASHQD